MFGELLRPVRRLGARFVPVPFLKPLETAFIVRKQAIVDAAREIVAKDTSAAAEVKETN
jgi:pyruvate/2-oxoglutarate/acetoin dehydrogenase E1 component